MPSWSRPDTLTASWRGSRPLSRTTFKECRRTTRPMSGRSTRTMPPATACRSSTGNNTRPTSPTTTLDASRLKRTPSITQRPTTTTQPPTASPAPDADVSLAYDAAGNRIDMSDGVGSTHWVYDNLNRPTSVTDPFNGTVGYGYDGLGNRTSLDYPRPP